MLDKKLIDYSKSDVYPFHMPGHKRQELNLSNPYSIDITEIEGFDNLHHATDILAKAQERASELYESRKAYYLINGSTCGILAAVSAATEKGDKVIVARNCHKAVYHGLYLRELSPIYIYPAIAEIGIQGQIKASQIEEALRSNPDVSAVIITSPTYDGVVSDIEEISGIVHKYGIPLIVDEAHGAHFGFDSSFPENAIKLGADAVIVSVHKTLPAFTQTALLHICSNRIDIRKIEKFLGIYETSSPSYVLMSGIENCIRIVEQDGEELFNRLSHNLREFYDGVKGLSRLRVIRQDNFSKEEAYDFDESKIIILTDKAGIGGEELIRLLLNKYNIQLEMAAGSYALAIATIMDTQEGFHRLRDALIEIDKSLEAEGIAPRKLTDTSIYYRKMKKALEIHEAQEEATVEALLEDSIGKISGEYIYLYPPGIPLIVPGEVIGADFIRDLREVIRSGLDLQGLTEGNRIIILKG